uniref:Uncharacterized protein n=1 Tax=Setaria viridis TaxID=4556 RepID=A0A4U6VF51_SETVI|nr:hypothetical protein SEVIR_7G090250v2 [Setaria viridis]TKW10610.1 hypothetical protein SEVIR_6G176751v2 [Setaria viridis]TKW28140.1 hypothetical protein SEVIR_3G331203v2 [Setaria viridis]TKW29140.1 hypothetical protein SEVIR_3G376732v2 [Setaria viridis]TKW30337.1 hypothetical protein SEVIR_2G029566v2 [Setaria viridis]
MCRKGRQWLSMRWGSTRLFALFHMWPMMMQRKQGNFVKALSLQFAMCWVPLKSQTFAPW